MPVFAENFPFAGQKSNQVNLANLFSSGGLTGTGRAQERRESDTAPNDPATWGTTHKSPRSTQVAGRDAPRKSSYSAWWTRWRVCHTMRRKFRVC